MKSIDFSNSRILILHLRTVSYAFIFIIYTLLRYISTITSRNIPELSKKKSVGEIRKFFCSNWKVLK